MGQSYRLLAILEPQSDIDGLNILLLSWNGIVRSYNISLGIGFCDHGLTLAQVTNTLRCMRACSLIATSPECRAFGDGSGVMLLALISSSSLYQAYGSDVQTQRS